MNRQLLQHLDQRQAEDEFDREVSLLGGELKFRADTHQVAVEIERTI